MSSQFLQLPLGDYRVEFRLRNALSEVGLDEISILSGRCPGVPSKY